MILLNSLAYMPTLGLINTISYYRLKSAGLDIVTDFPPIRIWGTIGFIMAMWGVSFAGFELSHMQLYIGAVLSVVLALFTLTLPHVPVSNQQKNQSWSSMLGLDAFALFKNKRMAIFFIFSMLLGAELQITNMFGNTFLHSFDNNPLFSGSFIVEHASVMMSISQISETLFILTIPFFLSRYGIKNVMIISIFAWMLRFGLFAYGDPTPFGTVLLVLSMIVYGCAFDFFNISGSVFVEKEVRPEIRASAQGMFLMMTNGFGCILGGVVSGKVVEMYTTNGITDWQPVWLIFAAYSLVLAIASSRCLNTNTCVYRPARRLPPRINRLPPPPALRGEGHQPHFAKTHATDSKSALPPGLNDALSALCPSPVSADDPSRSPAAFAHSSVHIAAREYRRARPDYCPDSPPSGAGANHAAGGRSTGARRDVPSQNHFPPHRVRRLNPAAETDVRLRLLPHCGQPAHAPPAPGTESSLRYRGLMRSPPALFRRQNRAAREKIFPLYEYSRRRLRHTLPARRQCPSGVAGAAARLPVGLRSHSPAR